jgi:hypothetical protein
MDSDLTHLRQGRNYMRRNAEVITPAGHATELFTAWALEHLREGARRLDPLAEASLTPVAAFRAAQAVRAGGAFARR